MRRPPRKTTSVVGETSTPQTRQTPLRRVVSAVGLGGLGRMLRDFATYLPTQAIPAIAGFIVLPVLARKLSPTDVGVLAIAQTLISLGWTALGAWLAGAIVREYPAAREGGELASFRRTLVRGLALVFGAIAVFALLLSIAAIVSSAVGKTLPLVLAAVVAMTLQNTAVSLFAANLRPRAYALAEVTGRVGGMALGTALVFHGYGVPGYLASLATASAIVGLIALPFAWPRGSEPTATAQTHVRRWIAYGVPASMASIVLWALIFVDRYLLAGLRDAAAVGVYTIGNTLGDKVVMVPMFAFATAATPLLILEFERRGRRDVERLLRSYTRFVFLVGIPCIAFIAAAGANIVTMIAGLNYVEYAPAARVAPIVAAGSLIFALAGMANTGLAVARRTKFLIASSTIGLATNVVANLLLIPRFGIQGAAVATPIGNLAYLLATYHWSRRYATWRIPYVTLARACVAGAGGYSAAVLVSVGSSRLLDVGLDALVGLPVYIGLLGLLGEHRSSA
jgi:O-antigen/teichoic acid export membrane protein